VTVSRRQFLVGAAATAAAVSLPAAAMIAEPSAPATTSWFIGLGIRPFVVLHPNQMHLARHFAGMQVIQSQALVSDVR